MKTDLLQHSSFSLHPFFSRFDQFADAPDAVAKMRELVLNLAVQGKLVERDPADEPASCSNGSAANSLPSSVVAKPTLFRRSWQRHRNTISPVRDGKNTEKTTEASGVLI